MDTLFATLYFAFNAVMPILLLILLGYFCRQKGILTEGFIKPANKFNFRCGISMLMFNNIYQLSSIRDISLNMVAFVFVGLAVLTVIGFGLCFVLTKQVYRRGVLLQAAFRSNYAIIGIPLAGALAGTAGSALATTVQAPTIIFYNFTAVLALSIFSDVEGSFSIRKVLKSIITNPLIISLIAGVLVLIARDYIPRDSSGELVFSISGNLPWLYTVITYLARMSTPLALAILGAQFSFDAIRDRRKELIGGVVMRIIGAPIIGFTLAFIAAHFGLITINTASIAMMISLFGSPMAVSSVVMSSEMHADDILCGQIVVWSSLLSMGTIFLQAVIFRSLGML